MFIQQVNFFIGAFYDGVYLLGMVLNETLTEGGDIDDIRNGVSITKRMWGRDFHGNFYGCVFLLFSFFFRSEHKYLRAPVDNDSSWIMDRVFIPVRSGE